MDIRAAEASELDALVDTLVLAFSADPPARYGWPTADAYMRVFRRLVTVMGGGAVEHGTADVAGGREGVALWLPPGTAPDVEPLKGLMLESLPPEKLAEVGEVMTQVSEFHPREPHWYLTFLGVDPARQGQGVGSALLKHALRRSDADGRPAYLEASSPNNVRLYERHGFELLAVVRSGDFPPLHPMLRAAR
jgi:ribosomal protein S18 acetylase RimI-like enzyme